MVKFDEATHKYFDGDKELISVTTLMVKHGLAPDYSAVNPDLLAKSAERGKLIHKEIEEYVKEGKVGFTEEVGLFIDWAKKNKVNLIASEKMVHNDVVAGTCDLIVVKEMRVIRIDIKTTSTVHKDACSWQLSLYDRLDNTKADDLMVLHFSDGELKEVPIDWKKLSEIDELLDCERKGVLYHLPTLTLEQSMLVELKEVQTRYLEAQKIVKENEEMLKKINETLISLFEAHGVKTFENDDVKITYVAPTKRISVDSTKLKNGYPEIYQEMLRETPVKASLKITLKGDKE